MKHTHAMLKEFRNIRQRQNSNQINWDCWFTSYWIRKANVSEWGINNSCYHCANQQFKLIKSKLCPSPSPMLIHMYFQTQTLSEWTNNISYSSYINFIDWHQAWIAACLIKSSGIWNLLLPSSHLTREVASEWSLTWSCRCSAMQNSLSHTKHLYGRLPLWIFMWSWNSTSVRNFMEQILQSNSTSAPPCSRVCSSIWAL